MGFPSGIPVIDTMIGFPHEGFAQYDFIRRQTKDRSSREEMEFPAEYMFGGYFPMGLSLERIFHDMPGVPFEDEVWLKFLHENARRILKLLS